MTTTPELQTDLAHALDPLVLAVDVGSSATRGCLHDAAGCPVERREKVRHAFTTAQDGTSEIDPDQVCAEVEQVIDGLLDRPVRGRVAGVAMDTFASSLVGVDAQGSAVTPCYTYADSRCRDQVTGLREQLDEAALQQRTGTRLHTSYLAPRLRWLAETQPDVVRRVVRWLSLGEYVQLRLAGATVAGTPTASWTGLLDVRSGQWDPELLEACGVAPARLSVVQDPGIPVPGTDRARVARRWPALADADWFPVVADGLSSNLGVGAADPSTLGAATATSGAMRVLLPGVPDTIPSGLWCYRVDGRRSLLGGAVNDVGRLVSWFLATLRLPHDDDALDAVLAAAPDPHTPVVVPYLSGERSTGWRTGARALVADLSGGTTPEAIFRGGLEGVVLGYARIAAELAAAGGPYRRVVASGRVSAGLPHLLQLLADALGTPVEHVALKRTTLRGTALLALETLAPDVPRAEPPPAARYRPQPHHAEHYTRARARFDELYPAAVSGGRR